MTGRASRSQNCRASPETVKAWKADTLGLPRHRWLLQQPTEAIILIEKVKRVGYGFRLLLHCGVS